MFAAHPFGGLNTSHLIFSKHVGKKPKIAHAVIVVPGHVFDANSPAGSGEQDCAAFKERERTVARAMQCNVDDPGC